MRLRPVTSFPALRTEAEARYSPARLTRNTARNLPVRPARTRFDEAFRPLRSSFTVTRDRAGATPDTVNVRARRDSFAVARARFFAEAARSDSTYAPVNTEPAGASASGGGSVKSVGDATASAGPVTVSSR